MDKYFVYQPNTQDILFLLQPCMEIVFYCHFEKALISQKSPECI